MNNRIIHLLVLASLLILLSRMTNAVKPIVLWHGMGDSCCFPFSMGRIESLIKDAIKQKTNETVFIHSVRIGDSEVTDVINSYIHDANEYVATGCQQIASIPQLQNGFNAIGFSQGSQFLRAYVQRCNKPAMNKLISIGGQHQGIFGLPKCPGINVTLCEYARELIDIGVYREFVQHHLIQAQYWNDPWDHQLHIKASNFLADINNERSVKNETYKQNLMSLELFAMVKFLQDSFVQPIESEWFGYYKLGQDKDVLTLQETELYQSDWLGLKEMDKQNKLKFLATNGDHLRFTDQWFIENIIPLLIDPSNK
jgi:palmitoyl-protein thioesterase